MYQKNLPFKLSHLKVVRIRYTCSYSSSQQCVASGPWAFAGNSHAVLTQTQHCASTQALKTQCALFAIHRDTFIAAQICVCVQYCRAVQMVNTDTFIEAQLRVCVLSVLPCVSWSPAFPCIGAIWESQDVACREVQTFWHSGLQVHLPGPVFISFQADIHVSCNPRGNMLRNDKNNHKCDLTCSTHRSCAPWLVCSSFRQ